MRRLALVFILVAALGLVPSAAAWTWPLGGDVLRPYSLGPDAYAAGQHRGVDVAGVGGESVRAPASGTISFAGVVPGSGRTVTIQLDGYAVSVTHLGEISVAKGVTVAEGQAIGSAGPSGEAEWPTPYVHLGIRVSAAADGYVDPATLLPPRAAVPPPSGAPVAAPVPVATPVVTPVSAPVVPVVTPVSAPVVTPIAVPVVAPTVTPTVTPAPVQVTPSRPAPRSSRPQAPGPVVAVGSRQAPATADSPRAPVSSEAPPVLAVGQPTIASTVVSTPVGADVGDASTAQRPLGGTGRVSLQPGQQVGAPPGHEALAVGSLPDALVAPGAAGSDPIHAADARSGTGVEPGERHPGLAAATATPSAANGVSADGSSTVGDRLTSPLRGGVAAAGPIDRGTTERPPGVRKQAAEADSGTIARDGSTAVEPLDVFQRGRRLAVAAAALLLVALGTIWLLVRLGRGDDDGRRPSRGQARLGRRGGVVVAGPRGSDRGRL